MVLLKLNDEAGFDLQTKTLIRLYLQRVEQVGLFRHKLHILKRMTRSSHI